MKPDERERLLRELLPGDELSAFRQESLAVGLSALKARKKRHRLLRASALAVFALTMAGGLLWQLIHPASTGRPVPTELVKGPLPSKATTVTFISDDELLSLFPDRPVALIGRPGHQQLLFLDEEKEDRDYN